MKVIAVTASVFPEFREKAIEAGFDDFLGKPFRTEELIQKVRKHLDVEFVEETPAGEDTPKNEATTAELPPEFGGARRRADPRGGQAGERHGAECARVRIGVGAESGVMEADR